MKKLFYLGLFGISLFEVLNVYFIMPMPGSQRMNSLDLAYFLYSYRWYFRAVFGIMILISARGTFQNTRRKWIPALAMLPMLAIAYMFNFRMVADQMFKQPDAVTFKAQSENTLGDSTVVVGVENNGEVKAYPIRFIAYHHQVQDTVGGKPVIVTYCSVCRTARVFEPMVKGKYEKFRLVGMDHFNAMFEDATTKSWWRQATGEAVTGSLKGEIMPEVESFQLTLDKLFELHPQALVMQLDNVWKDKYDTLGRFERGKSKGNLTRTDSLSWKDKSWVVGIQLGDESKAYDWIQLKTLRIVNDKVGSQPIVLALASDDQSFRVFERPSEGENFAIRNDSLLSGGVAYNFSGMNLSGTGQPLKRIKAYQEFWHSWLTFHPTTLQYK